MIKSKYPLIGNEICEIVGCKENVIRNKTLCKKHLHQTKYGTMIDGSPIRLEEKVRLAFSYVQEIEETYPDLDRVSTEDLRGVLKNLLSLLAIKKIPSKIFSTEGHASQDNITRVCDSNIDEKLMSRYIAHRKHIEKRILFSMQKLPLDFTVVSVAHDLDYVDIRLKARINQKKKKIIGHITKAGTFIPREQLVAFMKHVFLEGLNVKLYVDKPK